MHRGADGGRRGRWASEHGPACMGRQEGKCCWPSSATQGRLITHEIKQQQPQQQQQRCSRPSGRVPALAIARWPYQWQAAPRPFFSCCAPS